MTVASAPIVDDDAAIARALQGANVLALVAATVQITGDPSILRGSIRPRRFVPNELDGRLTEEEQAELRAAALEVVLAFRDSGVVRPLEAPVLREIMDWLACEHVPDEYAEMFLEDMDVAGSDPRRMRTPSGITELSAVVIGCGMSGLLAGVRLKQAGVSFEIIEKNDDVGGTWHENTYPGCRVDVPNHYYCYSFAPDHGFGGFFSQQPELQAYFRDVMHRFGVDEHVVWRTEVERAEWNDDTQLWSITTRAADGTRQVRTAAAIICAVGQLNRPYVPDLANLDRFNGPVFHSARWNHDVDLAGKRVALIGAGASGFQIGPAIVDEVQRLVVFQRTAQWMMPSPLYHEAVDPGVQWAMRHLPGYASWYRFLLLWQSTDKMVDIVEVDPSWPELPRSANARSARMRESMLRQIDEAIGDDPELVAKVVPDYPPLGKRMLQDNGSWLRCLARDHVELVRDPIVDIEDHAVLVDGARYEVDVIILATGFRANEFLVPLEIIGRGQRSLNEVWNGRPAAYLGITVPDFPNLFLMYGPGTNLAHTGSIIFHSECQMRYIGECLTLLAVNGGGSIEPTTDAFDDYFARAQRELSKTVWAHPSVEHSWYKAADGNVYVLSPWRLVDYWKMTGAPDLDANVVIPPGGNR
jgi:4-hydroxyacetophenone monooxygenase